jgi:hypothetical protein
MDSSVFGRNGCLPLQGKTIALKKILVNAEVNGAKALYPFFFFIRRYNFTV